MTKRRRFATRFGARRLLVLVMPAVILGCSGSTPSEAAPSATSDPGPSGATCPDAAPTYDGFAKDFFASYCVRCHSSALTGASRHGAPRAVNFDTEEGVQSVSAELLDQMAAAGPLQQNTSMPADGPQPSRAERESLGAWLACGRP